MELELDRTQRNGYEAILDTTIRHEETMESIVPDACPDILRICDTEASISLRDKAPQEGHVSLSGSVRATLLYLPDGEEGLRRVEVDLPFTCQAEHAELTPSCRIVAVPRVEAADARLINPRKVLARVNLAVWIQIFMPVEESLCCGVLAPEDMGIQQLTESNETCAVICVEEKAFPFADELSLPGSKPEAAELLKSRVTLWCGESKVIGNKLIFKGESQLQLLYRSIAGELCTADFELPFSQIMEVSGAGEEAVCTVEMALTGLDCAMDGGDGRNFSVSMGLLAQAVVRETRTLQLLTDVYSTLYPLTADTRLCSLDRLLDHGERELTLREILETGALAREISDAYAAVGAVSQNREGDRLTLSAEVSVTVLYITEDGEQTSATRTMQAFCPLELPADGVCSCCCTCTSQVFAVPTSSGIEIRLPVSFRYTALLRHTTAVIAAVHMDETAPMDHAGRPSIVLRMVGGGERLWDIAKAYSTTSEDIMRANDLEEELLPEGQLLLIPKKR